jgi:glucose-1-phosphate cytidylyltransferase
MKVVILAGGRGTRISEETETIPKPMVEIGGNPILWHIMKIFSYYGFNDFIICLGYRGYMIKEYFSHYFLHMSDITINMKTNDIKIHNTLSEPWKITLIDTGIDTMTGGRINRIKKYVHNETFMLTYGDGVSDVNINELIQFHKKNKKYATVTAVQPTGRYGSLDITQTNLVSSFLEKPRGDNSWINAGFFVLEPKIFNYIESDQTIWEREPLENLSKGNKLCAFKHDGFWKPMDTLRDKVELERVWQSGEAPWKMWENE